VTDGIWIKIIDLTWRASDASPGGNLQPFKFNYGSPDKETYDTIQDG